MSVSNDNFIIPYRGSSINLLEVPKDSRQIAKLFNTSLPKLGYSADSLIDHMKTVQTIEAERIEINSDKYLLNKSLQTLFLTALIVGAIAAGVFGGISYLPVILLLVGLYIGSSLSFSPFDTSIGTKFSLVLADLDNYQENLNEIENSELFYKEARLSSLRTKPRFKQADYGRSILLGPLLPLWDIFYSKTRVEEEAKIEKAVLEKLIQRFQGKFQQAANFYTNTPHLIERLHEAAKHEKEIRDLVPAMTTNYTRAEARAIELQKYFSSFND